MTKGKNGDIMGKPEGKANFTAGAHRREEKAEVKKFLKKVSKTS